MESQKYFNTNVMMDEGDYYIIHTSRTSGWISVRTGGGRSRRIKQVDTSGNEYAKTKET